MPARGRVRSATGRGGTEPTITDANLLLGRLDPKRLLAVDNTVTLETVEAVFAARIGAPTGLSGIEAAGAALKLANQEDGRGDPHGLGFARPRPA